ncbi:ankyrin repeat domain-containing protein [Pseudanabaena sp. UWO310]|uniref:ankyrin repeat domain-containing protein n=1 Tax=Pseudanabaena sp. UWO310 TaxID=2480795 RepID=UPI001160EA02|nr:ankyrin repeat domain-containing protein [Pseudanabaena sp. UWO310]TYQ23469.1 DUF4253 domain-containing protein [Pseudanabaena sp. UWO310]
MLQNRDRQLIEAVRAKNISTVRELLAEGANPNLKDGDETLLEIAEYDREIRYALVEAGAWDNALRTEMVMALDYGVEVVKILIEKGADVNVQTFSGTPLSVAARKGDLEIVKILIEAGADVDDKAPLNCALEVGHFQVALQLLASGASPNSTDTFHSTPAIALASAQGGTEVVKALVQAGADVNTEVSRITINQAQVQKQAGEVLGNLFKSLEAFGGMLEKIENLEEAADPEATANEALAEMEAIKSKSFSSLKVEAEQATDTSPLILAARCGHHETVATLLELGATPHHKDGEGLSAFDWATRNHDVRVLDTLKSFGIVETPVSADEELLDAAIAGNTDLVIAALAKGANINTRDARRNTKNKTPLMLAALHNHAELVSILLRDGADPTLNDLIGEIPFLLSGGYNADSLFEYGYQTGRTALMFALQEGHAAIVDLLLEKTSDLNQRDGLGLTALMIASEKGHLEIVKRLVAENADVNVVAKKNSALSIAIDCKHEEIAKFLIESGADYQIKDDEGQTLLMDVASQGSLLLVQLLLEKGLDVNAKCNEGTALIFALNHYNSDKENIEVIEALLAAGADPNLGDYEKGNALTTSIYRASREVIAKLIEAGVDVGKRDREGRSALGLAKVYHRQDVLAFLRGVVGDRAAELEVDLEVEQEEDDELWGEEIEPPDFSERAATDEYQQAVSDLAEICGDKAIAINELEGGFYINVRTNKRKEIDVEALQNDFLERDCFVFQCDRSIDNLPHRLWILPTTDKYEAIAAMGTNGYNYGIGTGYVLKWLRELEEEQPFVITIIRGDLLSGRFLTPIQDPEELAERMYEFCPDLVDQGCGSVENLADSLKTSDNLYFWWD